MKNLSTYCENLRAEILKKWNGIKYKAQQTLASLLYSL